MTTNLPPGGPAEGPPMQPPTGPPSAPSSAPPIAPVNWPGPVEPPFAQFFDRIRSFGLFRPDDGRWLAGVCAGIARRTGVDVVLVRGAVVILTLLTSGGLVCLYGLGWLLLPHPDGRIHAQEVLRGVVTAGFVGSAITVLVGLPSGWDGGPFGWGLFNLGPLALLVVIGVVVWLVSSRGKQGPGQWPGTWSGAPAGYGTPPGQAPGVPPTAPPAAPPTGPPTGPPSGTPWATSGTTGYAPPFAAPPFAAPPVPAPARPLPAPDRSRPSHGLTRATLGAAVVAGSTVALVDRFGTDVPLTGAVAVATALTVVALGIVAAGLSGRRAGGLTAVAWILAPITVLAVSVGRIEARAESDTWRPTSRAVAEAGLARAAGDVVVDLTDPALLVGATNDDRVDVNVSLGAGRIVLVVPGGTATQIQAQVGLGEVDDDVTNTRRGDASGQSMSFVVGGGSEALVQVEARLGLGKIVVVPAGSPLALGQAPASNVPTSTLEQS